MLNLTQGPSIACATSLAIAVIGPDDERRKAIASALGRSEERFVQHAERYPRTIEEFCSYPLELDELPRMLALCYDVVFIDPDSDTEYALDAVGSTEPLYVARAGVRRRERCQSTDPAGAMEDSRRGRNRQAGAAHNQ